MAKSTAMQRIKDRLGRQSTWSVIGIQAAAAAALFPVYAVPLGTIAVIAGLIKPFLPEDNTVYPENPTTPSAEKEAQ